jgi:hypothetical protein
MNHFYTETSYTKSHTILGASPHWEVKDRPEDKCFHARLVTLEPGMPANTRHAWLELYWGRSQDDGVMLAGFPYTMLMLALELTLQSRFIDLDGYGQYVPWAQLGGWDEETHARNLRQVASWMNLNPDLPQWSAERRAALDAWDAEEMAEIEAHRQERDEQPREPTATPVSPQDKLRELLGDQFFEMPTPEQVARRRAEHDAKPFGDLQDKADRHRQLAAKHNLKATMAECSRKNAINGFRYEAWDMVERQQAKYAAVRDVLHLDDEALLKWFDDLDYHGLPELPPEKKDDPDDDDPDADDDEGPEDGEPRPSSP